MYAFHPIGVIKTPILSKEDAPIQSSRSNLLGSVELYEPYLEGLVGIERFSHVYLLYIFDRTLSEVLMKVKPFLDDQEQGLFTTRYPCRPNPIGFSVVEVINCENKGFQFRGADMLNETPLIDIKPYIPDFDVFNVTRVGWYQNRTHR